MNNACIDQTEDEIVSFDISDEALEAAEIAINSTAATPVYCAALMCPWWEDS
jgi:hypothetical protein